LPFGSSVSFNGTSVSAETPRPDSLPYTVTKFGLQGMTHQLTMDGRKHNIVSSIIHPDAGSLDVTARNGDLAHRYHQQH
jgi:NAD(P)-dependent dehydrogenase (short-subunit alcohol dehydrogenase family)